MSGRLFAFPPRETIKPASTKRREVCDGLETAARGRLPLRPGAFQDQCRANHHRGLPLHRLPEDEFVGLPAVGRHSCREVRDHARRTCGRRPARRDEALFLPALHELDVHPAGGFDWFVNIRSTMLDDTSGLAPFMETWRAEGFAWAKTGAVHSYETLPPLEAWEGLMKEYREWAER